jgi:siroheme synthase-like protein
VARDKAEALVAAGARVTVVAPEVDERLASLAASVERRGVTDGDLEGVWLVLAAATPDVNRAVKQWAEARRIFVIAVDDLESCSAMGAAQLHRGGLTVAISSDGRAPALVALLRRVLEELIPDDVDRWVSVGEKARAVWKSTGIPPAARRPLLLDALNAMYARTETAR